MNDMIVGLIVCVCVCVMHILTV